MKYLSKPYRPVAVADGFTRHLLDRFTYGHSPTQVAEVRNAGGALKWFETQLSPERVVDPLGKRVAGWWPEQKLEPYPALLALDSQKMSGADYIPQAPALAFATRIHSSRQVLESVTEFWEHHLYVPNSIEFGYAYRSRYTQVIRKHALGKFADMLFEAVTHPCMGFFLTNVYSTKSNMNENLGRELLELHTVGVGNHTEDDVLNAAKVLTGWFLDTRNNWKYEFRPDLHATGPVQVLGWSHENRLEDGEAVTRSLTDYLARHRDTARRICRKLAVRYVSDSPTEAFVDRLADVYLANDTAIKPVLRALVASPEFKAASVRKGKVRLPAEDVAATYRALGVQATQPRRWLSMANHAPRQAREIGLGVFDWMTPDGPPDVNTEWLSSARLLASVRFHHEAANNLFTANPTVHEVRQVRGENWWVPRGGRTPKMVKPRGYKKWRKGVKAKWRKAWRAQNHRQVRFGDYVDHLSRVLLGVPASRPLLNSMATLAGVRPNQWVSVNHAVFTHNRHILIAAVLDSPAHMTR